MGKQINLRIRQYTRKLIFLLKSLKLKGSVLVIQHHKSICSETRISVKKLALASIYYLRANSKAMLDVLQINLCRTRVNCSGLRPKISFTQLSTTIKAAHLK